MKIIYISSACYPEDKDEIDKTAKVKLENNIIKFHNLIIDGLKKNEKVNEIYSVIGLPISIKTNSKVFWRIKKRVTNNVIYTQVAFINLPIIKQLLTAKNIYTYIKRVIKQNKNQELLVIYDASFVSVMPKVNKLIQKYKLKSIGIFADIYDYMAEVNRKSNKNTILKSIIKRKMNNVYNNTNAYIFLTKQMNELINKSNKPYIIIEGIADIQMKDIENNIENKFKEKILIYAGGLYEKYGVKTLVEAVKLIKDDSIRLYLYGAGELEEYIRKINDNRIKFFGLVSNKNVIENEMKATLLINPRFSNEEYTKYSFPSKIMEYMSTGTPVLTTRLQGIPEEYFNYIYSFENESKEGIKLKIEEVLNINKEDLYLKGKEAQRFILEEKNNIIQAKKIIELYKEISN